MIDHMLESIHELPEWEGHKIGLSCPCGGRLETVSGEFTIEGGESIGRDEVVRCQQCGEEHDVDDLLIETTGHSATTANQDRVCA